MNILMISDVYFPRVNGVSTSIRTFRRQLIAEGARVALVCPEYGAPADDEDDGIIRVAARPVPRDPEDRLMHWRRLSAVLRRLTLQRWDVVHVQTPFLAHYAGLAAARRQDLPCVATYHTLFEEYLHHYVPLLPRAATAALARRISRDQCNGLAAVAVPSPAMAQRLREYGVRVPMRVLPTGVELREAAAGDGGRFRARHGIAPQRPMLLFVGRVAGEKNIEFLLHMLSALQRTVPEALLVVAGEGPAAGALGALARRLRLDGAVRFVGNLDRDTDLWDCYRAADLFVFASRTETQGLVLLEAMAAGLPVVALSVMGTRDILEPRRGCVVAADDAQRFAATVGELLRDAPRRSKLSQEAVAQAREWSAPAAAQRLRALYRELIDNRRSSAALPRPSEA